MVVNGENIRKIHKRIYQMTIQIPKMYLFMEKISNKLSKITDKNKTKSDNADVIVLFLLHNHINDAAKKIINHEITEKAEKSKQKIIKDYIKDNRLNEKWFYLASSHNDCAEDHIPYQGKMYYDEKAPEEVLKFARKNHYHSIQWVMDAPAWFITRPNCRHFFKALSTEVVMKYDLKELIRRYKTHRSEGDRDLSTPRHVVIKEYEDRLKMLEGLYSKHPTEKLRREIQKIKLLIKKWKNIL